jgi:CRP-like cAMP-binding protein
MKPASLIHFFHASGLVGLAKAEEISGHFRPKEIRKNEFLLKENRVSDDYFYLEEGFMRGFAHDTEGNDISTNFFSAGNVVFEVSSFFNRTPSKENIQALTDSRGWTISYRELNELFHGLHEFRDFGRHVLVKGFAALKTRMLSMITETAEERYESLLKNNPEIFQQAQLKHIASFLGVTDSSLSRIRKEFEKK